MTAFLPSEHPGAHTIAAKFCLRCEMDHAVYQDGQEISHGCDTTEHGCDIGPESCPNGALWLFVRQERRRG